MDADAILKMAEDALIHLYLIIYDILRNDAIIMKSVLNHP